MNMGPFIQIWNQIRQITMSFITVCDKTYNMIINNTLLLCFVLMCAIFVGLALLKRLIHT